MQIYDLQSLKILNSVSLSFKDQNAYIDKVELIKFLFYFCQKLDIC